MRCGSANFSTKDSVPPLCSSEPGDIGLTYGFPSDVWPVLLASVTVLASPRVGASKACPSSESFCLVSILTSAQTASCACAGAIQPAPARSSGAANQTALARTPRADAMNRIWLPAPERRAAADAPTVLL